MSASEGPLCIIPRGLLSPGSSKVTSARLTSGSLSDSSFQSFSQPLSSFSHAFIDCSRVSGAPAGPMNTRTSSSPGSTAGSTPCCSATRWITPSGKRSFTRSSSLRSSRSSTTRSILPPTSYPRKASSELRLQILQLTRPLTQLPVRGPLPDPAQRPADGFRAIGRDPRGDQRVQRFQVHASEPGHHGGETARDLVLLRIDRGAVQLHNPDGGTVDGFGAVNGDHEPPDLWESLFAELLQPIYVFVQPRIHGIYGRRVVLPEQHPEIKLSRLAPRVAPVLQQHEPRHRALAEALLHLVVNHLLNAIHRRPFHATALS